MVTLRAYQQENLNQAIRYTIPGARILYTLPTGGGKTLWAGHYAKCGLEAGRRVWFCCDQSNLVNQTYKEFRLMGLNPGIIQGGKRQNLNLPLQIASVQTLRKRKTWLTHSPDLLLLDEAHRTAFSRAGAAMLKELSVACILGLTATPWRTKGTEGLGDLFHHHVTGPLPLQLMQQGYLVPIREYYSLPSGSLDLSSVRTTAGDYNTRDLSNACNRPELINRAVAEWVRLTFMKRTIAFCVDVQHSKAVCAAFNASGIPAAHVDGTMKDKECEAIYSALDSGQIMVLCSVAKLTTGFNSKPVEVCLMLRPTKSRALYFQMIGRILRISPSTGKTCGWLIDQANNFNRFGAVEELRDLSPDFARKPTEAPTKQCPECDATVLSMASKCPACGHQFPGSDEEPEEKRAYDGQLVLVKRHEIFNRGEALKGKHGQKRADYRRLLVEAKNKNYKPRWAAMQFNKTHGHYPTAIWGYCAISGTPDFTEQHVWGYWQHLSRIQYNKTREEVTADNAQPWIKSAMRAEFGAEWESVVFGSQAAASRKTA